MQKTTEEKIDYIYKTLKKQEKRRVFKIIFKIIIFIIVFIYILYFYYFTLPSLLDSFKNFLKVDINTNFDLNSIKKLLNK